MATEKQREAKTGALSEAVNDWIRQFLKHLELYLLEAGQDLGPSASESDFALVSLRAVKSTLLEAGFHEEEISNLFGRVSLEFANLPVDREWNADLNRRRLELMDKDIQGNLTRGEQIELKGLTQLMRTHVDSEVNMPLDGARKLHRLLSDLPAKPADSDL